MPVGGRTVRDNRAVRAVRVYRHIEEVEVSVWDSVLGADDLQLSHRFIRACQLADIEGAEYRFVLIEDAAGLACVAALSCFEVRLESLTSRYLRAAVSRVRRWYEKFLRVRVLFCGLPVSFGRPCIRFRQDADRGRCLEVLDDIMAQTSRELDASLICWKEYDPSEAAEVDSLLTLGYVRAASLPSCRLAVRWTSFEEYTGQMRSGYRHQVRHTQSVARRAGLAFRTVQDFGPWCDEIHGMYEQVMDRVEFQLERLNRAYFEELNLAFPTEASAILVEQRGTPVASAVVLDSPSVCAFLLAGIDYASNRTTGAYVNLVTRVVAHAIGRGVAILEMGQTSYDIKCRLGARVTPRYLYLRHRSRVGHELLRWTRGVVFPPRTHPARHVFRNEAQESGSQPSSRGLFPSCGVGVS
jgi:predicted N-acyltransferase